MWLIDAASSSNNFSILAGKKSLIREVIKIYFILEKYTDFLITKRTIKVYMKKQNGYWVPDVDEDLFMSLSSHGAPYFVH